MLECNAAFGSGYARLGIRNSPASVFHNLVFVSIKKSYPIQAYKIMHGL